MFFFDNNHQLRIYDAKAKEGWWGCVKTGRCFPSTKASAGGIGPGQDTLSPRLHTIGWSLWSPDLRPHPIGPEHGRVSAPSSGWSPVFRACSRPVAIAGTKMGSYRTIDPQPAKPLRLPNGCYESEAGAWEHPWILSRAEAEPVLSCSVYTRGGSWSEVWYVGNQAQRGRGEW